MAPTPLKKRAHLRYGLRYDNNWIDADFQPVPHLKPENMYTILFMNRKQVVAHRAAFRRAIEDPKAGWLAEVTVRLSHVAVVRTR